MSTFSSINILHEQTSAQHYGTCDCDSRKIQVILSVVERNIRRKNTHSYLKQRDRCSAPQKDTEYKIRGYPKF